MNVSVRKVVQQLSVKVLPAMLKKKKNYFEEHLFIFLKFVSNDQNILW